MPTKRPSKKRSVQAGRQRSRRSSKPNVYVQSTESRSRNEEAQESAPAVSVGAPAPTGVTVRPRGSRRQQGRQRSEVFARTLPSELRKLSVLVVVVAIVLAALTVVMRQSA